MTILCVVSGHGFGHATRVACLLQEIQKQRRETRILVQTVAPAWLFPGATILPATHDIGVCQRDGLTVDLPATLAALRALQETETGRAAAFRQLLREKQVRVVVSDIPALPLRWARECGVYAIAIGNFSWDYIYGCYAETEPAFREFAQHQAGAYAATDLLLRLPLAGPLPAFRAVREVPQLARRSRLTRAEARAALGLPADRRIILLTCGGFAMPVPAHIGGLDPDWHFVSFGELPGFSAPLTVFDAAASFPHEDVVAAADVVIGKPGYGTISECLTQRTKFLYLPREDYPENRWLVEGLHRHGIARELPGAEYHAGVWGAHIRALLADDRPWPELRTDGAAVAAAAILAKL